MEVQTLLRRKENERDVRKENRACFDSVSGERAAFYRNAVFGDQAGRRLQHGAGSGAENQGREIVRERVRHAVVRTARGAENDDFPNVRQDELRGGFDGAGSDFRHLFGADAGCRGGGMRAYGDFDFLLFEKGEQESGNDGCHCFGFAGAGVYRGIDCVRERGEITAERYLFLGAEGRNGAGGAWRI